ncbi:MAG TPA: lytic transglycosylase domain-containing protein, partial [Candidatus Sulfopaludibacter sp.]|nr:lytic transglycosylase domain-containing protein [Candidatus Sulfopaludibacter sp.]
VPATARRFGVADVFNPEQNIEGGARYLKYLLDLFNNDYRLALAAYNAGEGAVLKYGDVPPYAETRNYLVQVRKRLAEAQKASEAAARQKQKDAKAAAAKPEGDRQIERMVNTDGTVRYVVR